MAYCGSKKKINKFKKRLAKSSYKKIKGGVDTLALKTKLCEKINEHHLPENIENQLRKLNKLNTPDKKVYAFNFLRKFYERAYNSRRRNTRAEEGTFRVFKPTGPRKELNKCDIAGEIIDLAIWSARHVPRIDNLIINLNRLNLEINNEILRVRKLIILLLKRKEERKITINKYNNTYQQLKTKITYLENMKTALEGCLENLRRFDRNNLQSFKNLRNNREAQPMIGRCEAIYRGKDEEFQQYRNHATASRVGTMNLSGGGNNSSYYNENELDRELDRMLEENEEGNKHLIQRIRRRRDISKPEREELVRKIKEGINLTKKERNIFTNEIIKASERFQVNNKPPNNELPNNEPPSREFLELEEEVNRNFQKKKQLANILTNAFINIEEREMPETIWDTVNSRVNKLEEPILNGLIKSFKNSNVQQKLRELYRTKRDDTMKNEGKLRYLKKTIPSEKKLQNERKQRNTANALKNTLNYLVRQEKNRQTSKKVNNIEIN